MSTSDRTLTVQSELVTCKREELVPFVKFGLPGTSRVGSGDYFLSLPRILALRRTRSSRCRRVSWRLRTPRFHCFFDFLSRHIDDFLTSGDKNR